MALAGLTKHALFFDLLSVIIALSVEVLQRALFLHITLFLFLLFYCFFFFTCLSRAFLVCLFVSLHTVGSGPSPPPFTDDKTDAKL